MEEVVSFGQAINSLGLPGWVLIFTVILIVLNYLGILPVLVEGLKQVGASVGGAVSAKQTLMARLIDKALDQNGTLVNFITDKLLNQIEELEDTIDKQSNRIVSLETHIRMITYHLTEVERTSQKHRDEQNFQAISDLQERLASIESKRKDEPAEGPVADNPEDI